MVQREASNKVPRGGGQEGNDGRRQRQRIGWIIYALIVDKDEATDEMEDKYRDITKFCF